MDNKNDLKVFAIDAGVHDLGCPPFRDRHPFVRNTGSAITLGAMVFNYFPYKLFLSKTKQAIFLLCMDIFVIGLLGTDHSIHGGGGYGFSFSANYFFHFRDQTIILFFNPPPPPQGRIQDFGRGGGGVGCGWLTALFLFCPIFLFFYLYSVDERGACAPHAPLDPRLPPAWNKHFPPILNSQG